jgi:hypothetical protein
MEIIATSLNITSKKTSNHPQLPLALLMLWHGLNEKTLVAKEDTKCWCHILPQFKLKVYHP